MYCWIKVTASKVTWSYCLILNISGYIELLHFFLVTSSLHLAVLDFILLLLVQSINYANCALSELSKLSFTVSSIVESLSAYLTIETSSRLLSVSRSSKNKLKRWGLLTLPCINPLLIIIQSHTVPLYTSLCFLSDRKRIYQLTICGLSVFTKSVNSTFRAFWLAPVTRNNLGYSLFYYRSQDGVSLWGIFGRRNLSDRWSSLANKYRESDYTWLVSVYW